MSTANTGGPAFPQHGFDTVAERFTSQGGMTLRDYFAAKAMAALIQTKSGQSMSMAARFAYDWADEMMKAREA